jgi:sialic acid synthase SpsE
MSDFAIGSRVLGPGRDPYLIAEIGVNHDGDPRRAAELVRAARDAGADAVKFQLFDAARLLSADARFARYQEALDLPDPRAMLEALELPVEVMVELAAEARGLGIDPIVTVFSVELVAVAESIGVAAYKTASPDLVHRPLLEALAATGRPLIVSTGAATLDEVLRADGWLARRPVAFLQCVSSYPTPDLDAELAGIASIARATSRVVGYSDHTGAIETGGLAVAAGASILEKHLTYDRTASGPDHAASLDPAEFAAYAAFARRAAGMLGSGKRVLSIEEDVRAVSRQSLVAARSLPRGRRIERSDLVVKRPGTGLPPWTLEETIGRVLLRDVEADRVLRPEDLAP